MRTRFETLNVEFNILQRNSVKRIQSGFFCHLWKNCPLAMSSQWYWKLISLHGIENCFPFKMFQIKRRRNFQIERNWNEIGMIESVLWHKHSQPKPCNFNYDCCNFHVCLAFINQLFKYIVRKRIQHLSNNKKGKTKY